MLPFADSSFDLYTIAFGLRNVTNKDVCMYGPICIRMTYSMLSLYWLNVYIHIYVLNRKICVTNNLLVHSYIHTYIHAVNTVHTYWKPDSNQGSFPSVEERRKDDDSWVFTCSKSSSRSNLWPGLLYVFFYCMYVCLVFLYILAKMYGVVCILTMCSYSTKYISNIWPVYLFPIE